MLLQQKFGGFSRCPFSAELENVPNFIPSYQTLQDIAETVKLYKLLGKPRFGLICFLIWHPECFFNISGSIEARNKIKDFFLNQYEQSCWKNYIISIFCRFLVMILFPTFLKTIFQKITLLWNKFILTSSQLWEYLHKLSS